MRKSPILQFRNINFAPYPQTIFTISDRCIPYIWRTPHKHFVSIFNRFTHLNTGYKFDFYENTKIGFHLWHRKQYYQNRIHFTSIYLGLVLGLEIGYAICITHMICKLNIIWIKNKIICWKVKHDNNNWYHQITNQTCTILVIII